jgi:hypothetical protein
MAEIPYKPVPTVQPVETGAPKITETVPHVEISNAVGKALEIVGHGTGVLGEAYKEVGNSYGKLGKAFEGAGDELWHRAVAMQQLELDKGVDKAELALIQQNSSTMEQALANPNLGPEGMKAIIKQQMDNREAAMSGLNPYQQEQLRKKTMSTITYDARRLASHVAGTERKDTIATAEAIIDQKKKQLGQVDLPEEDARRMQQELKDITINQYGPAKGIHGPQLEQKLQDDQDDIKANQILNVAESDINKAMEMYNRSKSSKNEKDFIADPQRLRALHDQLVNKATSIIPLTSAHDATQDPNKNPDQAEREAGNDATKKARDAGLSGDDQIRVLNDARSLTRRLINDRDAATNYDDSRNQNDIARFIVENKIKMKEELPKEMQAQLEKMGVKNFSMQQSLKKLMLAPAEDVAVNDENTRRFWQHKAALDGSLGPDARKQAMSVLPLAMENMPTKYKDQLMTATEEQFKIGAKARENVPLDDLYHFAKGHSLLTKKMGDEKEDIHAQWKGLADIRLRQAIADNKGPLNDAQKREVIYKINTELLGTKGLKDVPGMQPASERQIRDFKATNPAARNVPDEELQRLYQNWVLRERYRLIDEATKAGKIAPTGKPAPTEKPALNILSPTPLSNQ